MSYYTSYSFSNYFEEGKQITGIYGYREQRLQKKIFNSIQIFFVLCVFFFVGKAWLGFYLWWRISNVFIFSFLL